MTLSEEELVEMRAVAERATPGPWVASRLTVDVEQQSTGLTLARCVPGRGKVATREDGIANATFIAAFNPAKVIALLDDRDALQAALKEATGLLKPLGDAAPEFEWARDPDAVFLWAQSSNIPSRPAKYVSVRHAREAHALLSRQTNPTKTK